MLAPGVVAVGIQPIGSVGKDGVHFFGEHLVAQALDRLKFFIGARQPHDKTFGGGIGPYRSGFDVCIDTNEL